MIAGLIAGHERQDNRQRARQGKESHNTALGKAGGRLAITNGRLDLELTVRILEACRFSGLWRGQMPEDSS